MSKFNPQVLSKLLWRCPFCLAEDSIDYENKKVGFMKHEEQIHCNHCKASWKNLSEKGMELFEGPNEYI